MFYLASIVLGLWTLGALTGELENDKEGRVPSIRNKNVVVPAIMQVFLFIGGTTLVLTVGLRKI